MHYKANRTFLKFVLVKRSKQFGALGVHVDVALELLVDAVHLGVIFQGVDFALLQRLGEELYRLLHHPVYKKKRTDAF